MTLRDDVRQHVSRLGLERDYRTDATSKYTITLASQFMDVVEAALTDAGVNPQQRREVLDRVMYGSMPSRADAEQRKQLFAERFGDLLDGGGATVATGTNAAGGSGRMVFDPESQTWLGGGGGVSGGGSAVATGTGVTG